MKKILPKAFILSIPLLLTSVTSAFAQSISYENIGATAPETLDETIRSFSLFSVTAATALIVGFVLLTIVLKPQADALKKLLFSGIIVPTILASLFLVGSTLILNYTSHTKGPVHWHADFQVWDCGEEVDLINPQGFSNKVGTPSLHEHNDERIHVEGVVVSEKDVSLSNFFKVLGGDIGSSEIRIPTDDGLLVRRNGDLCPDGSPGTLQVFLYKVKNATATQNDNFAVVQTKLDDPADYVLSPFANVPPGDCVIIEFDPVIKNRTDKLCNFYEVEREKGNLYGN